MHGRRYRLTCPIFPDHGLLYDWPSEEWGFYCPHRDHDGYDDEFPATRAFFTTDEAESGVLDPRIGGAPPARRAPTR